MGMKKILCAIIGLLFTIPSWGACYDYTSATGTVSQIGTPTPDNPIYPTFYKQGDMVLRKVGNIADTYDATTGKITRRVGEYTFTGRENISMQYNVYGITDIPYDMDKVIDASLCSHNKTYVNTVVTVDRTFDKFLFFTNVNMVGFGVNDTPSEITDTTTFKQWLAAQYAAGTPVKIYYPLETEVVEDWAATTYCPGCDGTVVNYTSATGTVTQNGTPTPTNPITPVFYTQGNMVLRKVGDYADTYDATTGKITRRVGVAVLNGRENFSYSSTYGNALFISAASSPGVWDAKIDNAMCTHYTGTQMWGQEPNFTCGFNASGHFYFRQNDFTNESAPSFKQWLTEQYAAGTPVTIYYPLATETTEDWPASYCQQAIKVASTKYVETEFSALNTALANAVATVNTVVTQTIAQAASIATLQSGKQTRPADNTECPAYKQCLLVEDENGTPHWYQITDPFRDFVAPIIANNVNAASSTSTRNYTQLEYIESTGTQYIDTGITSSADTVMYARINYTNVITRQIFGANSGFFIGVYDGYWQAGHANSDRSDVTLTANTWYDVTLSVVPVPNSSDVDITLVVNNQTTIVNRRNFGANSIALFGLGGTTGYSNYNKLAEVKIYQNDILVRNFVPVRSNATGKYGMYDTVGGRFYGNANTSGDDFTPGPIVENDANVPIDSWVVTWTADASNGISAGTVRGTGICNSVAGSGIGAKATNAQMASSDWNVSGKNCWCQITGLDTNSVVTSIDTNPFFMYTDGTETQCYNNCTYVCKRNLSTNVNDSRSVVFGQF